MTPLPAGSSARAAASPSMRERRPSAGTRPWGWTGGSGFGTMIPPASQPRTLGLRQRDLCHPRPPPCGHQFVLGHPAGAGRGSFHGTVARFIPPRSTGTCLRGLPRSPPPRWKLGMGQSPACEAARPAACTWRDAAPKTLPPLPLSAPNPGIGTGRACLTMALQDMDQQLTCEHADCPSNPASCTPPPVADEYVWGVGVAPLFPPRPGAPGLHPPPPPVVGLPPPGGGPPPPFCCGATVI